MKVTVLGCGTSSGVPRVGNHWGRADPSNPKNRRRRVSVAVEQGDQTFLVDTSPDLRMQLLDADIDRLDGVFYSHDHADHAHGIDDLRGIFFNMRKPIDVFADDRTLAVLKQRFDYVFEGNEGYPAIAKAHEISPGEVIRIAGREIIPFEQQHGPITSLGFRFGNFAYSTDVNGLPDQSKAILEGLDLWVVDALRYDPHPTHAHLDMTLGWIEELKPRRAVLTHLTTDMDYAELQRWLPDHIEPGFDGMEIILNAD
ncbi:MAG: MBL fold metallo-hydrolase [Pseudomonadota bacterium]